ncbi:MAG: GFA family protein [Betaproteobacteria bacterium]
MTIRQGKCLCGEIEYTVTGEPLVARICWCRVCQRISGNGTANAIFPSEAIVARGNMSCFISKAESGSDITRHFCPKCGSHLFASASATPQFRVVRLGTLDDPSSVAPTINMWVSSAPSWACLDPSLRSELRQPASAQSPPRAPSAT